MHVNQPFCNHYIVCISFPAINAPLLKVYRLKQHDIIRRTLLGFKGDIAYFMSENIVASDGYS